MIDAAAAIPQARQLAALRAARGAEPAGGVSGGGFAETLRQARQAAIELVSSAFIVPVLDQLRESPFQVEPFAPNFAQERFAPLLDERIADRIVGSAGFDLVDAIVDRLAARLPELPPRQEALDARA